MLRWVSWRVGQELRLVGGVAQEAVPEAVPTEPDLGDPLNERGVLQAHQRLVDRPPGQLAQRLLVELGTERGRQLRDMQVDAGSPEARREDLVDARGKDLTGTRGDGAAGQLLQEERDAGSALDDLAALRRIELAVGQRGDQPGRLLLLQRFQLDVDDPRGPRRVEGEPARDQDHGAGNALGGQESQQVDGGRVGPVEVVGPHQGRRRGRRVRQPGDEGLERLLAERQCVHLRA